MAVTVDHFGTTASGQSVDRITLVSNAGLALCVIQYGAAIQALQVPGPGGVLADVVLGYDTLDRYESPANPYHGAIVGRHANRIGGAAFSLNDTTYLLYPNEGHNNLHGGPQDFSHAIWDYEILDSGDEPAVRMSYFSPDGESGFPGNLNAEVIYRLTNTLGLVLEYEASADQDTVINLTNHSYFNLAGQGEGHILNHQLTLEADTMTPVDAELLPDGRVVSVGGTPFDFRTGKAIGRDILAKDEQLRLGMGFDHNFIVRGPAGTLRPCATVTEPLSGRAMTVETTAHAVQFYTGNQHRHQVGKNGAQYDVHCGFCLETQFYPDSLRHPQFPSPVFKAGETFRQTTRFRFNT